MSRTVCREPSRSSLAWRDRADPGHNRAMDLTAEQIAEIEALLGRIEELDAAEVPEPAAQLAEMLGRILDDLS